jgi:hypothetical protein
MRYKFEMVDEYGSNRVLVETDSIFLDEILDHFKSFLQASGFGINHDDALTIEYDDSEVDKILGSSKFELPINFTNEELGDEVEESPEEVTEQVKSWFADFPTPVPCPVVSDACVTVDRSFNPLEKQEERIEFTSYMMSQFGLVVIYRDDTLTFKGPVESVRKIVINHYASPSYAKKQYPELFGE